MATAEEYAIIGQGFSSSGGYSLERTAENGNRAFNYEALLNEDETDVAFINRIYRGENPDYFLGGWIVKAVTDVLLQFMGMPQPESKGDKNFQEFLSKTYENNKSKVYNLLKFIGLYGQSYVELGYNTRRKIVTFKPLTKQEVVEVRKENFSDPDDITYVRIRTTVQKFADDAEEQAAKLDDDLGEKEYIHFDKIYWKVNNTEYEQAVKDNKDTTNIPEFIYYAKVLKIENDEITVHKKKIENVWNCIPVVEFNQGRLNGDVNGFSDANGIIKLAGVYHQILERAIDTNMYNGQPSIVFTGLDDPNTFIKEMYGGIDMESGDIASVGMYDMLGGYYLKGNASVNYLTVGDTVTNARTLLELLFYIFIQMSGVPEWALGANINNTYASTKMQSNSLIQKVEGKRFDVHDSFLELNEKAGLIHESFEGESFNELNSTVVWKEIIPDEEMSLQTRLTMAREAGLITDESFMRLLNVVKDYSKEIKDAKKQDEKRVIDEAEKFSILEGIKNKLSENEIIDDVGEMSLMQNISTQMIDQLLLMLGDGK